jgi:hypothetical protein
MRVCACLLLAGVLAGCVMQRTRYDLPTTPPQLWAVRRDGGVVSGELLAASDEAVLLGVSGVPTCIYADELQSATLQVGQPPIEQTVSVPLPNSNLLMPAGTLSSATHYPPEFVGTVDVKKLGGLHGYATRQSETARCARPMPPGPVIRRGSAAEPPPAPTL